MYIKAFNTERVIYSKHFNNYIFLKWQYKMCTTFIIDYLNHYCASN